MIKSYTLRNVETSSIVLSSNLWRLYENGASSLVAQAVAYLQAHGIRIIHVDFLPERAAFYEHCGFRVGLGGIYEQ